MGAYFNYINSTHFLNTGTGYENGTVSGNYVAFIGGGAETSSNIIGSEFNFIGTYLTSAWNEDLNISLKGFKSGNELYSTTVTVDPYTPTWFEFNFIGIDELTISSYGGTNAIPTGNGGNFAMDNFTYSVAPEPISATLFVTGGALLTSRRFMKRNKKV